MNQRIFSMLNSCLLMKTNAKLFVKDDQSIWSKETNNGTIFSGAIDATTTSVDLTTGFISERRNLVWIKGSSEEVVREVINMQINAVNKGQLAIARQFSLEPFYQGQVEDINPQTQEPLGRYSRTVLCTPEDFHSVDRKFVVVETVEAQPGIVA